MRHIKRAAAAMLSICLCLVFMAPMAARAGTDEYTYTVRFFAGSRGKLKGSDVVVHKNLHYGDRVTFNQRDVELTSGKYYVRGIRESGKDNNTADTQAQPSFLVTGDQDYVVTYGILGDQVMYTVNYVDEAGNPVADPEVYYGNVGDRPVVAYLYVEGYLPQAFSVTGTLTADASKNVFTFVYRRMSPEAQQAAQQAYNQVINQAPAPAPAAATTTPAATPAAPDGPGGTDTPVITAPDDPVPEAEQNATEAGGGIDGQPDEVDVQDPEVPLANQNLGGVLSNDFAKVLVDLPLAGKVGICSAVFLLGGVGGFVLTRKKRKVKYAKPEEE